MWTSDFGNKIVTIYISKKREEFTIHSKLICKYVDFFSKACVGPFQEGQDDIMYLPEDVPGVFALFVEWLYRRKIPTGHTQQYLDDLYGLYFFGEKVVEHEVTDQAMDMIQDMSLICDRYIDLALVSRVYKNTPSVSALRDFANDLYVYGLFKKQQAKAKKGQKKQGTKGIAEGGLKAEKPAGPIFRLSKKEIMEIWEHTNTDSEFFFDLFSRFQDNYEYVPDPRIRNEKDPADRCYFHSHPKDKGCRVEDDEEQAWIESACDEDEETSNNG